MFKDGKRLLLIAFAISLAVSLLGMSLNAYVWELPRAAQNGGRFILTLALWYGVWRGFRWVRWIAVVLTAGALLYSLYWTVMVLEPYLIPFLVANAFVLYVLVFNTSTRAFLRYQRERAKTGDAGATTDGASGFPAAGERRGDRIANVFWAINGFVVIALAGSMLYLGWQRDRHNVVSIALWIGEGLRAYEIHHGHPPESLMELEESYARAAERSGLHYAFTRQSFLLAKDPGSEDYIRQELQRMVDHERSSEDGTQIGGHLRDVFFFRRPGGRQ